MTKRTLAAAGLTLAFTLACGGGGGASGADISADIAAAADPGTGSWDQEIASMMVGAYDSDGSGSIDTASEVNAIPCTVWQALDKAVLERSTYESNYFVIYGVAPDFIWVGGNGIDESMRETTWSAMQGCGMKWP